MLRFLTTFERSVLSSVKEYTLRELSSMFECSRRTIKKALKSARRKIYG